MLGVRWFRWLCCLSTVFLFWTCELFEVSVVRYRIGNQKIATAGSPLQLCNPILWLLAFLRLVDETPCLDGRKGAINLFAFNGLYTVIYVTTKWGEKKNRFKRVVTRVKLIFFLLTKRSIKFKIIIVVLTWWIVNLPGFTHKITRVQLQKK